MVYIVTVMAALMLFIALRVLAWRVRAPKLSAMREGLPEATVLLPVRNEEDNISECLGSLLQQVSIPRIIVIDDNSEDRTREIAQRFASQTHRISLFRAGELPAGWKGKVHALEAGLREVKTPWVLSTDADTRHHPELLARALATAQSRGLDSLSIAGFQETLGLGENLLTPAVFAALDGLLGDWRDVADGNSAVANGQFILVRTEALEAIGRFESVRGEPLDDVALASRLRAGGFRHAFFRAPELLRIRMYQGFSGTFRGWRRNLGAFLRGHAGRSTCLLFLLLFPVFLMLWGAFVRDWSAVLVIWIAGCLSSMIFRAGSRHPAAVGLLYPLDALLLGACILLGLRDAAKGRLAQWKGRAILLHKE